MLFHTTHKPKRGKNMIYMKDEEILQKFQTTRRLKPQTIRGYKDTIRIYTQFNNLTLQELFTEAINEEIDRIRWADRTLKRRLEEFRIYLYDTYTKKTARMHFGRIKTVYAHFDIEIHKLPPVQSEDKEPPITYKDLPTKQILQKAINISEPMIKALILFMVSTGCAKKETRHITIQDFIEATKQYHNKDNITDVLNVLKDHDDIVPIFHIYRYKTKKWYYTCATPEATTAIIHHLIRLLNNKQELKPTDRIFGVNKDYFSNYFIDINTALGLGKVRKFNRFTSHMLRRYHASTLQDAGMDKETVNRLQGKGQNPTDDAYFKVNPVKLREKYMEYMDALYVIRDTVDVKSPEFIQLENENKELRSREEQLKSILERIEALENK